MKHRMSCPAREDGGICACAALTVWKGLRYKKLIPPPAGKAYGFDTDYWKPIRAGSNFEVPSFRPRWEVSRIPLATGKSKKLYLRAVSKALVAAAKDYADMRVVYRAARCDEVLVDRAFYRLLRLAERA